MTLAFADMHFRMPLPGLAGGPPPDRCPLCARPRVPTGADDGDPPPHVWLYVCDASYARPEDGPDGPWEPERRCPAVSASQVVAWVRAWCAAEPALGATAAALARVTREPPPYHVPGRPPLGVTLPSIRGPEAPATCPVCGSADLQALPRWRSYACGGGYWVTSTAPGAGGASVPTSWGGLRACTRASLATILAVVRAHDPACATAYDEALATLAPG